MPPHDQLEFQRQVIEQMRGNHRRPFRHGVAVEIALSTTAVTPGHIHNVAKNVLDLLGVPRRAVQRGVGTQRRGLLYYDDAQVEALSVSSVHTNGRPRIDIIAVSLHDFLEDLGLAARAQLEHQAQDEMRANGRALERWFQWRNSYLDKSPTEDDIAASLQADAQREWLQPSRRYLWALAELFSVPTMPMWAWPVKKAWAERDRDSVLRNAADRHLQDPMLRIPLSEPPHQPGMSAHFRAEVVEQLEKFKARHRWILDPLRVPMALDVVVKPPPTSAASRGRPDLDNLVREYVLPRVATVFAAANDELATTPGEHSGIVQYRAWRLPRHDGDDALGYVSVGITAAYAHFHGSLYDQIDRVMLDLEREADYRD